MKHKQYEPSLVLNDGITEVINLKNFIWFSDILIETGTSYGSGVERALIAGFSEVRSVEMQPERVVINRRNFSDRPQVKIYEGDSRTQLFDMIPDKPCVIFLDAHPSGPGSSGHDNLLEFVKKGMVEKSDFHQNNILREELKIILKSAHKHLIILDDQDEVVEEWIEMFPDYYHEHVNSKYLVLIPNSYL